MVHAFNSLGFGQRHERGGEVAGAGLRDQVGGRALAQHLAAVQHHDAVGVLGLVDEMRRPQHADALAAQLQHMPQQVAARRGIETDRRLVHQQNARLVHQRARQLDAAAVAARQFAHLAAARYR